MEIRQQMTGRSTSTGRGFGARGRTLVVLATALAVSAALVAPAAAAPAPDTTSTTRTRTDGSTTTTTTTGPSTTETTAPPASPVPPAATPPGTVPPDQVIPTAGPPELEDRGIRLPGDSLVAAITELGIVRGELDQLVAQQATAATRVAASETKLASLQDRVANERATRLARAVATYQGRASGWQLSVLTKGALDDERALYLSEVADAAAQRQIKKLERSIDHTTKVLADQRSQASALDGQVPALQHRIDLLTQKIADSAGVLGLVLPPGAVAAANSKVALLADATVTALNQALAAARPLAVERPWLDTRHALATALVEEGGDGGKAAVARLEAEWDATSPAVLRVVLFALRQVGKPYVYATAGPDTFDCSGLTKRAYAEIGIGMPHFSGAQLALGIPVLPTALRPGDLLTYGPSGAEHVTMYVGAGVDVEARGRAYGVVVTGVRLDPAKGFAGAVRFVP